MATIRIDDLPPLQQLSPEELEQVLGAGRNARPGLETLEGRVVPASLALSSFGVSVASKVAITPKAGADLVIAGRETGDRIQVTQGKGASVIVEFNGVKSTHLGVGRVVFDGRGGDDFFLNMTKLPTLAHGGAGNDTLIGGSGADLLFGDTGMDALAGQGGNDTLFASSQAGGEEGFQRSGQPGAYNALSGGEGQDTLYGSTGNDYLSGGKGADGAIGFGGQDVVDDGGPTSPAGTRYSNPDAWRDQMFGSAPNQGGNRFRQGIMDGGDDGAVQISDSSTDTQYSDGSQSITRTEGYTNSDGTKTNITTTHHSDGKGNSSETQTITQTNADGSQYTETHSTETRGDGSSTESHSSGTKSKAGLPGQESSTWVNRLPTVQPGVKTVPAGDRKSDPRVVNPDPSKDPTSTGGASVTVIRKVALSKVTTPGSESGSRITIRNLPDLNGGLKGIDPRVAKPSPIGGLVFNSGGGARKLGGF